MYWVLFTTSDPIFRRGLALLNPYNAVLFTIKIIVDKSLKRRILLKVYHD